MCMSYIIAEIRARHLLLLVVTCLLLSACGNKDDLDDAAPSDDSVTRFVVTGSVMHKTERYVDITGYVSSYLLNNAQKNGIEYGIELSAADETFREPLRYQAVSISGNKFFVRIFDLPLSKVYYYKAYVEFEENTYYGKVVKFMTSSSTPKIPVDYVDLGLSDNTLWATCNLGAKLPEDFGTYYAFAETESKTNYSLETYKYKHVDQYDKDGEPVKWYFTKYCELDHQFILLPEDDAATYVLADDWKVPSMQQYRTLLEETKHSVVERDGICGLECTSFHNGKKIFLPAAGIMLKRGVQPDERNAVGIYRTNEVDNFDYYDYKCIPSLYFTRAGDGVIVSPYAYVHNRFDGLPIRPVKKRR